MLSHNQEKQNPLPSSGNEKWQMQITWRKINGGKNQERLEKTKRNQLSKRLQH